MLSFSQQPVLQKRGQSTTIIVALKSDQGANSVIAASSLAKLSDWIETRRIADATPGVSLAIIDRAGAISEQAFGLANLDAQTPMTPAHLFETGSIGKSFTAIALLQLQEEGKINLQAPVTDYLPWFAVQTEFAPIRLHHLLTHTAGITSGIDFAPDARIQVWQMRETWTTTPPGAQFHYSNIGYKVLGVVLERVAGAHYRETIQTRILDRIGLHDSVPTITHEIRPKMAVGYGAALDDRPWWPGRPLAPATWFETDTADGCLAMTAADLARYLAVFLKRGDGLISPDSFAQLTGKGFEFESETEPNWYGYGVMASIVDGHQYIGHSGGMVGYHSRMIGDLQTGIGVVALVNGPGSPSLIARTALDFLRAEAEGWDFAFPANRDPDGTDNAEEFAGAYRTPDGSKSLIFSADGRRLALEANGRTLSLRSVSENSFGSDEPGHDRFLFSFERQDGTVSAVSYGGEWFANETYAGGPSDPLPAEWEPFPGRYRSHNPWLTSFDVVARQGKLWLITPTQSDGFDGAEPLFPDRNGWFRLGADERKPEFIRFSSVVDGIALEATLSTGAYYRAAD
jgi:D-alanyl-D-alanine carboxypeptidase